MKIEIKNSRYVCTVCGFTYDSYREVLQSRATEEVAFEDLPNQWKCVQCGCNKDKFRKIENDK
jgi:rubredoxin